MDIDRFDFFFTRDDVKELIASGRRLAIVAFFSGLVSGMSSVVVYMKLWPL